MFSEKEVIFFTTCPRPTVGAHGREGSAGAAGPGYSNKSKHAHSLAASVTTGSLVQRTLAAERAQRAPDAHTIEQLRPASELDRHAPPAACATRCAERVFPQTCCSLRSGCSDDSEDLASMVHGPAPAPCTKPFRSSPRCGRTERKRKKRALLHLREMLHFREICSTIVSAPLG